MVWNWVTNLSALLAIAFGAALLILVAVRYGRGDNSAANAGVVAIAGVILLAIGVYPALKLSFSPEGKLQVELERLVAKAEDASRKLESTARTLDRTADATNERVERVEAISRGLDRSIPRLAQTLESVSGLRSDLQASSSRVSEEVSILRNELARVVERQPVLSIPILMGTVFFETGKENLLLSQRRVLDEIVLRIKEITYKRISLIGYADSTGVEGRNVTLSLRRAAVVRDYLVKCGVPDYRISSTGRGPIVLSRDSDIREEEPVHRRVDVYMNE